MIIVTIPWQPLRILSLPSAAIENISKTVIDTDEIKVLTILKCRL